MYHVSFPGLGLEFTVNRVAFSIFGYDIYWYGVLIAFGIALAMVFVFKNAQKFGLDDDKIADVIMIGLIGGIIGLRAFYVAFSPVKYDSFWDMVNIRDGGLAIYGGLIAGVLTGALMCKWKKVKFLPLLDLVSVGFFIGQSIGRWGNFTNQEVFGTNTTLPWGMISEGTTRYLLAVQQQLASRGIIVDPYTPVHPTFLYESIWCVIGAVIIVTFMKHRKYDGQMSLFYIAWYGLGRAYIESIRSDTLLAGSIRVSLAIGVFSAIIAVALLVYFAKKGKTGITQPLVEEKELPVEETESGEAEKSDDEASTKEDVDEADVEGAEDITEENNEEAGES